MEFTNENQPHPWHYFALAAVLALIAFFAVAVYVTGKSFSPESFANADQQRALFDETIRHTEELHSLQEADQANADAHMAQRRQYLTWFVFGLAGSLTGLVALMVLTSGAVMTSWSFRRSVENLAMATQVWQEVRSQPMPIHLPGGFTALPPTLENHRLLDTRTGQATRAGADTPASAQRTHLEQVDAVRKSVEKVAEKDAHTVASWWPGLLQTLLNRTAPNATPPPHQVDQPLVFGNTAENQNHKTKK